MESWAGSISKHYTCGGSIPLSIVQHGEFAHSPRLLFIGDNMCKNNPLSNVPMPHKLYSTTERNAAQGILEDCTKCSRRKQRKCRAAGLREAQKHKHHTPMNHRSVGLDKITIRKPPTIKGQLLSSKTDYKLEIKQPIKRVKGRIQCKIVKIIHGKTRDRYQEMIHS